MRRLSVPLILVTLAACARSEPVETFKPDRAEERVKVSDNRAATASPTSEVALAKGTVLAPKDECAADPGFAAYRERLAAAVTARDADQLKTLVDPKIKLSFGGDGGIAALEQRLSAAPNDGEPALWDELGAVLTLGCALDKGTATMPYGFARSAQVGPETLFPLREDVALHKEPSADSPVVARLGWHVLTATAGDPEQPFIAVKTDGGTQGYVARDAVRSGFGYRALFNKDAKGEWAMTALVAGD